MCAPLLVQLSEQVKKLPNEQNEGMKAVERGAGAAQRLWDLLGCIYTTTGQFSASLCVFLIPLWLFKYLELLVFFFLSSLLLDEWV